MTEQSITTTEPSPKEIEVAEKKYEKWCQAFLKKDSPTYGNATQSALAIYKTKSYRNATSIGYQNYRKLQGTGLVFLENQGMGAQYWIDLAAKKAKNGSYEQVVDLMQRLGIMDKDANGPTNQNNLQFNFNGNMAEAFAQARKARGLDSLHTRTRSDSDAGTDSGADA